MTELKQAAAQQYTDAAVFPLAEWWKATVALERDLDYVHSDPTTKAAWNDLVGRLMLAPSEPLYRELAECVRLWRTKDLPLGARWHTLLDAYMVTAWEHRLCLSDHPELVAHHLHQRLDASPLRG